jgi:hypothetical protein
MGHGQDQFASGVAGQPPLIGKSRCSQGKYALDDRLDGSLVDERADLDELRSAGFNDERARPHVTGIGFRLRRLCRDRNECTARAQDGPRPLQRRPTDRVENDVDVMGHVFEWHLFVVDDLVTSQPAEKRGVLVGCRSDHICPRPFGELDRVGPDSPGGAVDQGSLSLFQSTVCEERLPRR